MEYWEPTQRVLQGNIPLVKRLKLTDTLLRKPPFRFLHDVISEVCRETGYAKGLYTPRELVSTNIKGKEDKVAYLRKIIDCIGITLNAEVPARPSKVVAGLEPEQTNVFLQMLAAATMIDKEISQRAVACVLNGGKQPTSGQGETEWIQLLKETLPPRAFPLPSPSESSMNSSEPPDFLQHADSRTKQRQSNLAEGNSEQAMSATNLPNLDTTTIAHNGIQNHSSNLKPILNSNSVEQKDDKDNSSLHHSNKMSKSKGPMTQPLLKFSHNHETSSELPCQPGSKKTNNLPHQQPSKFAVNQKSGTKTGPAKKHHTKTASSITNVEAQMGRKKDTGVHDSSAVHTVALKPSSIRKDEKLGSTVLSSSIFGSSNAAEGVGDKGDLFSSKHQSELETSGAWSFHSAEVAGLQPNEIHRNETNGSDTIESQSQQDCMGCGASTPPRSVADPGLLTSVPPRPQSARKAPPAIIRGSGAVARVRSHHRHGIRY